MSLSGKQKRFLRGLGNQLKSEVFVGREGVTAAVLRAIEQAVAANELVKVKLLETFAGDRHVVAEELAAQSVCELIQVLGRTVLLYRRRSDEPVIHLPA